MRDNVRGLTIKNFDFGLLSRTPKLTHFIPAQNLIQTSGSGANFDPPLQTLEFQIC